MNDYNPRIADYQDYLDYLAGRKPKWFKMMREKHALWMEEQKKKVDEMLAKTEKGLV